MRKFKTEYWVFLPFNQEVIYNNGDSVVLPSRLSRCLEALISHNGETVDYDDLLQRVWQTEHRESSTISSVISELRKVIGCHKGKLTFIKTVPKKGYRFVMPFEIEYVESRNTPLTPPEADDSVASSSAENVSGSTPKPEQPLTQAPPQSAKQRYSTNNNEETESKEETVAAPSNIHSIEAKNRRFWSLSIAGFLIAVAVVLMQWGPVNFNRGGMFYTEAAETFSLSASRVATGANASEATVLTFEKGNELEFDVHADTHWLFYTHQHSHETHKNIRAKNLINGEVFTLNNQDKWHYASPRVAPDGDKLVYIRNNLDACEVRLVHFSEQGFDSMTDQYLTSCGLAGGWTTPDFSADGTVVYFARSESLTDPYKIYRYDLVTGHEWLLTSPGLSGRGDYSFSVSPDGSMLAVVRNELWAETSILIHHLKDSSTKVLTKIPYLIFGVDWLSNEELVYKETDKSFVKHHLGTGAVTVIASSDESLSYPVVANQQLYAFRGSMIKSEIRLADMAGGEPIYHIQAESASSDFMPVFANEGIYFLSDRSGSTQIWHYKENKLVAVARFKDGIEITSLLYSQYNDRLYLVHDNIISELASDGGLVPVMEFSDTPLNVSLSSDHSKIVYTIEEDSRWYIEFFDLDSHSVTRMQRGFSGKMQGNKLFFTRFHQNGLYSFELGSEEVTAVKSDFKALDSGLWDLYGDEIIAIRGDRMVRLNHAGEVIREQDAQSGIRNIQCSVTQQQCLFDNYGIGSTEIVELR